MIEATLPAPPMGRRSTDRKNGKTPTNGEAPAEPARWMFEKVGMAYRCWDDQPDVQIEFRLTHIKRSRGDLTGELSVSANLKGVKTHKGVLHVARFNVLSSSSRSGLARTLEKRAPGHDMDWFDGLEWLCQNVILSETKGEEIREVGLNPKADSSKQFLVRPLILKGRPSLLFGPGGVGKSLVALTCGLSVACGREIIPGIPPATHGPVLYLDWETTADVINDRIQSIAKGHGFSPSGMLYRRCVRPLADDAEELSVIVAERGVVLVIVDSAAYAMGGAQEYGDANESVLRLHEALRLIGVSSLIVDHVNKTDAKSKGGTSTPYGCYAAETEILTKTGWKTHPRLKDDEAVAAFDPSTGQLKWETPTAFHAYDYAGNLTEWATKATNALVTPNHRMLVRPGWPSGRDRSWDFIEAQRITTADWLLASAASPPDDEGDHDVTDDWASFLGWFVAEGSLQQKAIRISSTEPLASKIREVAARLGLRSWEKTYNRSTAASPRKPITQFVFREPGLADHLALCGIGAGSKRIPSEVFDWDLDHRQVFLDALIEGDGHQYSEGAWVLTTKSQALADDTQRLAILNGLHADVRPRHTTYKSEPYLYYHVQITDRMNTWFRPDRSARDVPYEGVVYCLTVPSGAYITRLDGRMAIHGNSAYKTNAARISWEIRKEETETGLGMTLYHAKSNDTATMDPIGLALDWSNDEITFRVGTIQPEKQHVETGDTAKDIMEQVEVHGKMKSADICAALHWISAPTVRTNLSRMVARGDLTRTEDGTFSLSAPPVKTKVGRGMFDD